MYSRGESEEIVGQASKGRRDNVMTAVEGSLRRLNTDYIDLYQYHSPDDATEMEETLSALTDLVRSGKVRAIGTSKQPADRRVEAVERLLPIADQAGISLTHMAIAFVIAHPAATAALLGPRTSEQLDDLLRGADVILDDDVLDQIDAFVAPGTDVGQLQWATNHSPSPRHTCADALATNEAPHRRQTPQR